MARAVQAVLLAVAAAAVAAASHHARQKQGRRLAERDASGGEMHVAYEAVPRAGVLVLGDASGASASCTAPGALRLSLPPSNGAPHVTALEHTTFLASSVPLPGPCGALGQRAPWYAEVRSTVHVGAGADGAVLLHAEVVPVNATDLFERCECGGARLWPLAARGGGSLCSASRQRRPHTARPPSLQRASR